MAFGLDFVRGDGYREYIYIIYCRYMLFDTYIKKLLLLASYTQDEDGVWIGEILWHDGYISQWETIEEARDDMIDVIESIVMYKLRNGDINAWNIVTPLEERRSLRILSSSEKVYA